MGKHHIGVVFGPNLLRQNNDGFRCCHGMLGIKRQEENLINPFAVKLGQTCGDAGLSVSHRQSDRHGGVLLNFGL